MTVLDPNSIQTIDDAVAFAKAALEEPNAPAEEASVLAAAGSTFGHYKGGDPEFRWLPDGRLMELLKPISYIDEDDLEWPVPEGEKVDGATIPKAVWSMVGGPYSGKYRNASIIHDRFCRTKSRRWRDVHNMFYDAMRCSGVSRRLAKIMYYSVYRFGPRWPQPSQAAPAAGPAAAFDGAVELDAVAFEPTDAAALSLAADIDAILNHDPDLKQICAMADARANDAGDRADAGWAANGAALAEAAELTSVPMRARLLVIPGGSGTDADQAAVADLAEQLPDFVVEQFFRTGARIIACRESITDFAEELREKTPRGWEATGRTWDVVPGAYFSVRKRVVVATIERQGERVVPTLHDGSHGSVDLLLHEALHGYDYLTSHRHIVSEEFASARSSDFANLTLYEQQEGRGGLEETFAESGARHLENASDSSLASPALTMFWNALFEDQRVGEVSDTFLQSADTSSAALEEETPAIGIAQRLDDGTLKLSLRASDGGEVLGHGVLTFKPGDPEFQALDAKVLSPSHQGPTAAQEGEEVALFIP